RGTRYSNVDAFAVFPSNDATIRRLASLHAVRAGPVSTLRRYYQGATTSCRPSRRASLPSLGGTTRCVLCFASTGQNATAVDQEFFRFGNPQRRHTHGDDRTSQVLGKPPLPIRPVLRLRQDCTPLTLTVRQHGPRSGNQEGSCIGTFEAQSHGF